MITQKTISEIFETAKVEDVVGDFVNLKRRGSNMIGLCPFHNEKTPSFSVSPSKNIYKCFGCGRGGSSIQFVMEHENFTYPEALRFIAEKYNIEVEETQRTDEEKAAQLASESFYIINQFAKDFYHNKLFNDPVGQAVGLSYFKERGFREHTIKKFELGFAPNEKSALIDLATEKGYNVELMKELGLVNQYGGDFFKDRVMFTIHSLSGKPIAFAGRALSTKDKRVPKYVNSPESKIYVKSKILYGLHFAKQAIRKKDNCYLVEGYTDVISLHQAGIENVVSSSGTSLTTQQIKAIQRYTPNVTVLYDGDSAGVKAALRGLDMILAEGMNVKLVLLPEGEDPDSFVQAQGQEKFEQFLSENAKDFILFKTQLLEKEAKNDPIKRSLMIKDVVKSVSYIPDSIKRSIYIQQLSELLKIEEGILVGEVNKFVKEDINKRAKQAERNRIQESRNQTQKSSLNPIPTNSGSSFEQLAEDAGAIVHTIPDKFDVDFPDEYQERDLMRVLINYGNQTIGPSPEDPHLAEYIFQNINDIITLFDNPLYNKVIKLYEESFAKGQILSYQEIIKDGDDDIRNFVIEVISSPYEYSKWDENEYPLQTQPMPEKNFKADSFNAMMRLKLRKIVGRIKINQEQMDLLIKDKTADPDELIIKIRTHSELLKLRNEITSEFKSVIIG